MTYSKRHLVLAALAGLVAGMMLMRLPFRRGHGDGTRRINHIARRLELTPEQKEQVRAAFARGRVRMAQLRQETRDEINAVLTEGQRAKFDAMMARHDKKYHGDTSPTPPSSNDGKAPATKAGPGDKQSR